MEKRFLNGREQANEDISDSHESLSNCLLVLIEEVFAHVQA